MARRKSKRKSRSKHRGKNEHTGISENDAAQVRKWLTIIFCPLLLIIGAILWANGENWGQILLIVGVMWLLTTISSGDDSGPESSSGYRDFGNRYDDHSPE